MTCFHTFFQIGTVALSASMQNLTASRESLLCGDEIPIITLASVTGTTLRARDTKHTQCVMTFSQLTGSLSEQTSDSPESVLYIDVSDTRPFCPDVTADSLNFQFCHGNIRFIFQPYYFLALKIISCSTLNGDIELCMHSFKAVVNKGKGQINIQNRHTNKQRNSSTGSTSYRFRYSVSRKLISSE